MMYFFCQVNYISWEAFDHDKDMALCVELVMYAN
jgi:hypothetical protein